MESFENGIYLVSIKTEQVSTMEQQNPVLNLHEVVAVYNGDIFVGHKVGDGVKQWSELEFTDSIKDIKECCLAFTVSADKTENAPLGNAHIKPAKNLFFTKSLGKSLYFKHSHSLILFTENKIKNRTNVIHEHQSNHQPNNSIPHFIGVVGQNVMKRIAQKSKLQYHKRYQKWKKFH